MRIWELVVGIIFTAFGGWVFAVSKGFPPSFSQAPGPGFFPSLLGAVTAGLGIAQMISAFLSPESWEIPRIRPEVGRVFLVAVLIACLVLIWQQIRFELAAFIFLAALTTFFSPGLWKKNLGFSLIVTILIVGFFRYGLRVPI